MKKEAKTRSELWKSLYAAIAKRAEKNAIINGIVWKYPESQLEGERESHTHTRTL